MAELVYGDLGGDCLVDGRSDDDCEQHVGAQGVEAVQQATVGILRLVLGDIGDVSVVGLRDILVSLLSLIYGIGFDVVH